MYYENDNNFEVDIISEYGIRIDDCDVLQEQNLVELEEESSNNLNILLTQIPTGVLSLNSTGTYKVSFDKGLGVLQKAKNKPGWKRANIVNPKTNNDVRGQALLKETSNIPNIITGIFSAISLATGLYYLDSINKSLKNIEEKVDKIYNYLEQDKKSHLVGLETLLGNIQKEYKYINDTSKNSYLNSLTESMKECSSNMNFYKNKIKAELLEYKKQRKNKLDFIKQHISHINELILLYYLEMYGYCSARYYQALLSENSNEEYYNIIQSDIDEKKEEFKQNTESWYINLYEYIKNNKIVQEKDYTLLEKFNLVLCDLDPTTSFLNKKLDKYNTSVEKIVTSRTDNKNKKREKNLEKLGEHYAEKMVDTDKLANLGLLDEISNNLNKYKKLMFEKTELIVKDGKYYIVEQS